MNWARTGFAWLAGVLVGYLASVTAYTQQVIGKQAALGAVYTPAQYGQTLIENLGGLAGQFGAVLAIALTVGFIIAGVLRRFIKVAPIVAFPLAGGAALFAAVWLIENVMFGGGVGAIGGARDLAGQALQGLAGAIGGAAFALLAPKRNH